MKKNIDNKLADIREEIEQLIKQGEEEEIDDSIIKDLEVINYNLLIIKLSLM